MKLYLIGFMGAGKSLLGKHLATGLGCTFFDLDTLIEEGEGMSVPEIFSQKGQAAFRRMEAAYLRKTTGLPASVIATGGGTPCFLENMDWMNEEGITLYLEASAGLLFERLKKEKKDRPLLAEKTDLELKPFIEGLLSERRTFYESSHFTCRAELPIEELTEHLTAYFRRFVT